MQNNPAYKDLKSAKTLADGNHFVGSWHSFNSQQVMIDENNPAENQRFILTKLSALNGSQLCDYLSATSAFIDDEIASNSFHILKEFDIDEKGNRNFKSAKMVMLLDDMGIENGYTDILDVDITDSIHFDRGQMLSGTFDLSPEKINEINDNLLRELPNRIAPSQEVDFRKFPQHSHAEVRDKIKDTKLHDSGRLSRFEVARLTNTIKEMENDGTAVGSPTYGFSAVMNNLLRENKLSNDFDLDDTMAVVEYLGHQKFGVEVLRNTLDHQHAEIDIQKVFNNIMHDALSDDPEKSFVAFHKRYKEHKQMLENSVMPNAESDKDNVRRIINNKDEVKDNQQRLSICVRNAFDHYTIPKDGKVSVNVSSISKDDTNRLLKFAGNQDWIDWGQDKAEAQLGLAVSFNPKHETFKAEKSFIQISFPNKANAQKLLDDLSDNKEVQSQPSSKHKDGVDIIIPLDPSKVMLNPATGMGAFIVHKDQNKDEHYRTFEILQTNLASTANDLKHLAVNNFSAEKEQQQQQQYKPPKP